MSRKKEYYWLAVTADKYELPLVVEESAEELAKMLGVHKGTIFACEARGRTGKITGRKIVKVKALA
ncbi:hypothetical protein [Lacrimispora sp.]|uniref:hypothetical protein n=1 Tax=Lacrimispora sp. TaxID=2719234 RepID=UPI0028A812C1|nr:hypothetical protein [Lacrimispora sp.]